MLISLCSSGEQRKQQSRNRSRRKKIHTKERVCEGRGAESYLQLCEEFRAPNERRACEQLLEHREDTCSHVSAWSGTWGSASAEVLGLRVQARCVCDGDSMGTQHLAGRARCPPQLSPPTLMDVV